MHVRVGAIAGIAVGLFLPEIRGFVGGLRARKDLTPIKTPADFQAAFLESRRKAMEE